MFRRAPLARAVQIRGPMSPFGSSPRAHRLGILFLFLTLALLALEVWGIRSSLDLF
jgi:hypothetical protein